MFKWLPTYTTDIYIQRERTGNNFRFLVTFIRGNELNGQMVIYDYCLADLRDSAEFIALRNLATHETKEEISLDRLLVHL